MQLITKITLCTRTENICTLEITYISFKCEEKSIESFYMWENKELNIFTGGEGVDQLLFCAVNILVAKLLYKY